MNRDFAIFRDDTQAPRTKAQLLSHPLSLTVNKNRIFLFVFVVLLGLPITIFTIADNEIPLSDVAVLLSIPFYFLVPHIREKMYFNLAVALSTVSIVFTYVFVADEITFRPVVSFVFFFRPYLLFFAGYVLIKHHDDMVFVLSRLAAIFAAVSIAIVLDILRSGLPVRIERLQRTSDDLAAMGSALAGSLFGLPLYATWGVHSLAVFYATMFAIILTWWLFRSQGGRLSSLFYVVGMGCVGYLIVGSLSREVLIGTTLLVCLMLSVVVRRKSRLPYLVGFVIVGLAALAFAAASFPDTAISAFDGPRSLIDRSLIDWQAGGVDALVSGRLSLGRYALTDIARDPPWGTGFHGFGLYEASSVFNGLSSPHNQYLTAFWKMGILPGIFYMAFLWRCCVNLFQVQRWQKSELYVGLWILMLVYLLVFCMAWDVLLVPLNASLIMFLLGGVTRIYYQTKHFRSTLRISRTAVSQQSPCVISQ